MDKKTTRVTLCGKELDITRPRFHLSFMKDSDADTTEVWMGASNDSVSGLVQTFTCHLPDNYKHISISELNELMHFDEKSKDFRKRKIFAEIFIDYLFERGIDLKNHSWRRGIYVNEGIRREGEDLIVFKNIDGKVESISEATYDTTVGYKIKEDIKIESERFNLERLFRKYGKKLAELSEKRKEIILLKKKEDSGLEYYMVRERLRELGKQEEEIIPLKHLDKSNPDFVDYLFGQEYETLPEIMKRAKFLLPPDALKQEEYDIWPKCNIWPLSLDISTSFQKSDSDWVREINRLRINKITIDPYQCCCGTHVIVKDKKISKN